MEELGQLPDLKSSLLSTEIEKAFLNVGILSFNYYPQAKLLVASDSFAAFFKCKKIFPNMPDSLLEELIHSDDRASVFEMVEAVNNKTQKVSANLRTKEGFLSRVTLFATEVEENGTIKSMFGIVQRLDNDVRANRTVEALSDDYSSVYYVDCEKDKVYPQRLSKDIDKRFGVVLRNNPPYEKIINAYIDSEVIDSEKAEMKKLCSLNSLKSIFSEKNLYVHDYRILRNDEIRFCRMKVVNLSDEGEFKYFSFGFSDMSTEKTVELERYAFVDPITGGDNYNSFKKKVAEIGLPGNFISMDIHNFKIINTVCGVKRGDAVIREIGEVCDGNCLNKENAVCGHVNADHFVIYVPESSEQEIIRIVEGISVDLMNLSAEMGIPKLIPYFGISTWNKQKEIESAISETTVAKHEVRDNKSKNYLFYSDEETKKILFDKTLEDAFTQDLAAGCFEVWYQPKFNPYDNSITGAEALTRWNKGESGYLSPMSFIPLFERDGFIKILDEFVFITVCKMQKKRKDNGLKIIPVSINLSRASIYFGDVVKRYSQLAEIIGVEPEYLPIEITETAAVANFDVLEVMKNFHEAGFPIFMDDFGTGYSSLAALNTFNFDTLKLDKSLIDYIGDSKGDKLLEHTIKLSKDLGINITAEGVESENQVEFLKRMDCDCIQGYYYSKPLPKDDFENLLDR